MTLKEWFDIVTSSLSSLAWPVTTLIILIVFKNQLKAVIEELAKKIKTSDSVEANIAGNSFRLVENQLRSVVQDQPQHPQVSKQDVRRVAQKATISMDALQGLTILWVDDKPQNNTLVISFLQSLGTIVSTETSSAGADVSFALGSYDIMISDMFREKESAEGLKYLNQIRASGNNIPVIFYVGDLKWELDTPQHAYAITNRADELVNHVIELASQL